MLQVHELTNPAMKSGYEHVVFHDGGNPANAKPYYAQGGRGNTHGNVPPGERARWRGPRRSTVLEAAQDYCDYVNGNPSVTSSPTLVSAGHTGKRTALPRDPEVQAALGVLRDRRGEREGHQGYVYCIGEAYGMHGDTLISGRRVQSAVKIGFSTNPEARVPELQTGNPRRLILLGKIKGTRDDEAALHAKYATLNILQEWFRPTAALLSEFGMFADGSKRRAA